MSIRYEMNLNKSIIKRDVYTSFDMLGDIGGLMGILFDFGKIIIIFITGNGLNFMIISQMFKEETDAPFDRTKGINGRLRQLSKRK